MTAWTGPSDPETPQPVKRLSGTKPQGPAGRLFDPRMYVEGLRQLRVIGLLYLIITELATVLYCVAIATASHNTVGLYSWYRVTFSEFMPMLCLPLLFFVPLMALYLLRFNNRREACDFYHALPQTRTALTLSFAAAVVSYGFAGVLLGTLTALVGTALLGLIAGFTSSGVLAGVLFLLGAAVYLTGVIVLAMSVTGTIISNVAAAALIALTPRLMALFFTTTVSDLVPILPSRTMDTLFDFHLNPLSLTVSGVPFSSDAPTLFAGAAYAAVIGVLYLAAGVLLFRRRKSEVAGQSAPNRILQAVFRLTLTMLVCLIPCLMIVNQIYSRYRFMDSSFLFSLFCLYVVALMVYFLYELITTRKVKNLLRAVPALGILLLLNAGFIGGVAGARSIALSNVPRREEIRSVTFHTDICNLDEMGGYYGYLEALGMTKPIQDSEILDMVFQSLSDSVFQIKEYGDLYQQHASHSMYTVDIETTAGTLCRYLPFFSDEERVIYQKITSSDAYREAFVDLPKLSGNVSFQVYGLTGEQSREIYETLRREAPQVEFSLWNALLLRGENIEHLLTCKEDGTTVTSGFGVLTGLINGGNYYTNIPLTSLTPEATRLYMEYTGENHFDYIRKYDIEGGERLFVCGVGLTDAQGEACMVEFSLDRYDSEEAKTAGLAFLQTLLDRYEQQKGRPVDLDGPLYAVSIGSWLGSTEVLYVNADDLPPVILAEPEEVP